MYDKDDQNVGDVINNLQLQVADLNRKLSFLGPPILPAPAGHITPGQIGAGRVDNNCADGEAIAQAPRDGNYTLSVTVDPASECSVRVTTPFGIATIAPGNSQTIGFPARQFNPSTMKCLSDDKHKKCKFSYTFHIA